MEYLWFTFNILKT